MGQRHAVIDVAPIGISGAPAHGERPRRDRHHRHPIRILVVHKRLTFNDAGIIVVTVRRQIRVRALVHIGAVGVDRVPNVAILVQIAVIIIVVVADLKPVAVVVVTVAGGLRGAGVVVAVGIVAVGAIRDRPGGRRRQRPPNPRSRHRRRRCTTS